MNILRAFARPMLATSFVLDGIDALTRPARHVERFEKVSPLLERAGLPPVLTAPQRVWDWRRAGRRAPAQPCWRPSTSPSP